MRGFRPPDDIKWALETSRDMEILYNKTMTDLYKTKPKMIALTPSLGPWFVICHAMGIIPIEIESISRSVGSCWLAGIGVQGGLGGEFVEAAERAGFSKDLCSFVTIPYGLYLEGKKFQEELPFGGGVPEPDVIIKTNRTCDDETKFFQVIDKYFKCPSVLVDVPFNVEGKEQKELGSAVVEYLVGEIQEMITDLERITGTKLDQDKLLKLTKRQNDFHKLIREITDYQMKIPAPANLNDIISLAGIGYQLSTRQECIDVLKEARDEIKERARNGEAALPDEKVRLLWHKAPPYVNRGIINWIERFGAIFVAQQSFSGSTSTDEFTDLSMPLEALARKTLCNQSNMPIEPYVNQVLSIIKKFEIDGILDSSTYCCPLSNTRHPLTRLAVREYAAKELGRHIPMTTIHSGICNPNKWNDTAIKNKLETLVHICLQEKEGVQSWML